MTETRFEVKASSGFDAINIALEQTNPSWGQITAKEIKDGIYEVNIVD